MDGIVAAANNISHNSKLVVIESPFSVYVPNWVPPGFKGYTARWLRRHNVEYARRCVLDSLARDEAPYASHLFYTQVLDDRKPLERHLGMTAGFAWGAVAALRAVYCDHGISEGMFRGIAARPEGQTVTYRYIDARQASRCRLCSAFTPPGIDRCGDRGCR